MKQHSDKLLQEYSYYYLIDNEDCTISSNWTVFKFKADSEEIQELYKLILKKVNKQTI